MVCEGLFRLGLIGACTCSMLLQMSFVRAQSTASSRTNSPQGQTNVTARSNGHPAEAAGPVLSFSTSVGPLKSSSNVRYPRIHDLERPTAELLEVKTVLRPARIE